MSFLSPVKDGVKYNGRHYLCNSQYNFQHVSFSQYLTALMKCVVFTVSEAIVTRSIENCIGMYIHKNEFHLIYSLIVQEQELFGVQLNNVPKILNMKSYGV